jgi:hypothetical protein
MREDGMELRVNLSRKRAKENVRKGREREREWGAYHHRRGL